MQEEEEGEEENRAEKESLTHRRALGLNLHLRLSRTGLWTLAAVSEGGFVQLWPDGF